MGWSDDEGAVVGLRARLDMADGVGGYKFVQDSDLVDAEHNAPDLRYGRPGEPLVVVEGLEPALQL